MRKVSQSSHQGRLWPHELPSGSHEWKTKDLYDRDDVGDDWPTRSGHDPSEIKHLESLLESNRASETRYILCLLR